MYNVEKYLRRCLDSVLNQTFKDWQAICVDDGSPDKSGSIAEEYAAKDKRFLVMHIKNAGVSNARNIAIEKANADYVMFLDSDDCIHPQTLETVYAFIQKFGVDIVSFRYDKDLYKEVLHGADIDKCILKRCAKKYDFGKLHYKKTDCLIKFATERNHSVGQYKIRHCYPVVHLYKRNLIKDIKFDTSIKISEDFPFWTTVLLKKPKSIILRTPFYFYIPHKTSALGSANSVVFFDNISLAIMKSFNNVNKLSPFDKWTEIWKREFLWPFIIMCMRSENSVKDKMFVKKRLMEMNKIGIFDNPPTFYARKYKRRIERLISQIS